MEIESELLFIIYFTSITIKHFKLPENYRKLSYFLDLSECELMQVPDAVYHLMRNTELKTCDLSSNVIKRIPPKFAIKFNFITGNIFIICLRRKFLIKFSFSDLNLSHNQMSKLPTELADIASLETLDISFNSFIALPQVCFKIPKLRILKANNNAIIGKF